MYNDLFSIGKLSFHSYGMMIGIGTVLALWWAGRRGEKRGISEDFITSMTIWIVVVGFAGGKLLYIITNWQGFLEAPRRYLSSEGFVVYGGIVTALIMSWLRCRHAKVNFTDCLDTFLPPVAAAQGFGRIGCFLAGCCYGKPTDSILGVVFPAGSYAPAGIALWPTQLFMAAGDFLLAAALLLYERRRAPGRGLAPVYLFLYGVGRFLIEYFRDDPRGAVGVFSTSQFISLFVVSGALLCYILEGKRVKGLA